MRIRAALVVAVLILGSVPTLAFATETTTAVEPTSSVEIPSAVLPVTPIAPAADPPVSALEDPVGVWLSLVGGKGTDSRQGSSINDARQVRWTFVLQGAPAGTEFHLWADFAEAGEIEAVGIDRVVVVTPAHDVLNDAYGHCILTSADMVVNIELAGVKVVPAAQADPAPSDPATSSDDTVAAATDGEPFLPYTGADDRLLVLAAACAGVGLLLRGWGTRPA